MKMSNAVLKKRKNIPDIKIWVMLLIIPIICYSLYLYTDIIETTSNSLKIWYLLFGEGKLTDFYTYRYPLIENAPQAGYDFFIYVIFAIWNIPLFIFEKITSTSYRQFYLTVWYAKTIIIFFLVLTAIQVYRIALLISKDNIKAVWSVFSFVFSISVFQTIGVIGGYDVISVFFTLCGIKSYFQNKNVSFLFYFSCAIACKLFAVWVFVPLLLLKNKKIIKVILSLLAGVQMILVPKIVFAVVKFVDAKLQVAQLLGAEEKMSQFDVEVQVNQIVTISHSNIVSEFMWGGEGPINAPAQPTFFFYTFILWVFCWFYREKLSKYQVIFVALLGMSIFFLTCNTYPYWFILLAPYMAILMCTSWENMPMKAFLEICMGMSYVLLKSIRSPQCYHYNLVVNMLHNEPEQTDFYYYGLYTYLSKLCGMLGLDIDWNLRTLATAVFAASTLMFIWYVRKDKVKETKFLIEDTKYFYWKAFGCILVSMIPVLGVTVRVIL